MKAWKHITTNELYDIQTLPGPLPDGYNAEDWELSDVTEAEIQAIAKIVSYTHSVRGIQDLFTETTTLITHNFEVFI